MSRFASAVKAASVLAVLFVVACTDDTPTDVGDPSPDPAIVDAVNGLDGNPFVFFKPPIVAQPSSDLFGDFNPDLGPVVEVCHVYGSDCTVLTTNDGNATLAQFTLDGGPGGESVIVDPVAEEYQVEIHFVLFDLLQDNTYRIVVRVGSGVLASAEIVVVSPREMKNTDTDSNIVFTNDQKTVPVKVRIDDGAMCWDSDDTEVISCAAATTQAGEEQTVSLTSSDGEEVDFHLPAGWEATLENGEDVTELTISIEEVPAQFGTPEDPACFQFFQLQDPETGEPANCYKVRADTDDATDVTVVFGESGENDEDVVQVSLIEPAAPVLPILAFCPSADVLQAIAQEGWIMTSVEADLAGTTTRTYANTEPASDFGGCGEPEQFAMEGGALTRFASAAWRHVRPILSPLLPQPLHAADLGFGGSIDRLNTIFFWSRTPVGLEVDPAPASVAVGLDLLLTPNPKYHEDATDGGTFGTFDVQWASANTSVATVNPTTGVVTGVAEGTTQITATAINLFDPSFEPVSGSTMLTVTPPPPPDLVGPDLEVSIFMAPATAQLDEEIGDDVVLEIKNVGTADIPAETSVNIGFYISTDEDITTADRLLQGGRENLFPDALAAGASIVIPLFSGANVSSTLPESTLPDENAPLGNVFIGVVLDEFNELAELDESNNTASQPIEITSPEVTGVTIDGVLSGGEWDGAETIEFDANVPDGEGGTTPATLFILNDDTNLYLAVRFARTVVDGGTNLLNFEFDHDNDGVGPENGDDYITFSPAVGVLSDNHRSCEGSCVATDNIRHGEGAFTNDGTHSVYEISHPLNSGETGQDLALTPPTTIGMLMVLQVGSVLTGVPDAFSTYSSITIN